MILTVLVRVACPCDICSYLYSRLLGHVSLCIIATEIEFNFQHFVFIFVLGRTRLDVILLLPRIGLDLFTKRV